MKKKDYIPENINDVRAVEHLKNLSFESIRKDVPLLLEWLQDTHWAVAPGIAEYLLPHINEITHELIDILNSDDTMWKSYVIYILIARSRDRLDPDLIKAIVRIAEHPSKFEVEDAVDEAAKSVIVNKHLCG